jgi:hypothetical protein
MAEATPSKNTMETTPTTTSGLGTIQCRNSRQIMRKFVMAVPRETVGLNVFNSLP